MDIKIKNSKLTGKVSIPVSKSYAHRILICAVLSESETTIIGKSNSEDVLATINCLKQLGATIVENDNGYIVNPLWQVMNVNALLDCNESGSTLRFLMPVVSALGLQGRFFGKGKLPTRPMDELINCLNDNGMEINDTMPYETRGQLIPGKYKIKGDISSQFISGLLMALPILKDDSYIIIKDSISSIDYINITIDILNQFGIVIENTKNGYFIKGNQKYKSPKNIQIEGDWSGAANFIVAGAISNSVTLYNLKYPSIQGDSKIIDIIKEIGADVIINENSIVISPNKLLPIKIDCDNIIDLVPILCIACANIDSESVLNNLERLKLKESNRLKAMIDMLEKIGISCKYDSKNSSLYITGGNIEGGVLLNGYKDHRIVMAGAISAINAKHDIKISDCEYVNKSYKNFFLDFKNLGGNIEKCLVK